jgi:diguanylate cyclase (GGDEF)-like protein
MNAGMGRWVDAEARNAVAARRKVSVAVNWKLLDELFAQTAFLPRQAIEALVVGLMLWLRVGQIWVLGWTAAMLVSLIGRGVLYRSYRTGSDSCGTGAWAWRFILDAWTGAALWGALGTLILLVHDPVVHLAVIFALGTNLCGAITRNSSEPIAALGQVCLMKLPLAAACLATRDPIYMMFGVWTLGEILVSHQRIQRLHKQVVGLLKANEKIAMTNAELDQCNQKLATLATTDPLTRLDNRRGFDVAFRREWRRALREHQPISLLLLDLDHFKKLNDTLGHQAGDECLQRVADGIQMTIRRPVDLAVRYGGEEFAVLLPDTDAVAGRYMAERLCRAVEALGIHHPVNARGVATVSVGLATVIPDDAFMPSLLIEQADQALYRAKRSGRNRCCACGEPDLPMESYAMDPQQPRLLAPMTEFSLTSDSPKLLANQPMFDPGEPTPAFWHRDNQTDDAVLAER